MVYKDFILKKPNNWDSMTLYQKIKYYGENMNKHYSKFIDKINAKQIIKQICGDEIKTSKILKVLNNPYDVNINDLSNNIIIKSAHGSGWNIPIINVDDFKNINIIHRILNKWNKIYSFTEKQYIFLKPKFFIEEVIDDKYYGKNGNAVVYMVRCIYGKAITISTYLKNTGEISNYDINWNVIYKNELPHILKPVHFDKIIKYAELLSSPFEFVRIDFHIDKDDNIYFSEFTFTPLAGNIVFSIELEKKFAELWI